MISFLKKWSSFAKHLGATRWVMAEAPPLLCPTRPHLMLQVEAAWLEARIRREFDKLREFLRVEEQAILDAMANEARQKQHLAEEKMKRLTEDTEALAHEIERLQMEMKEDDVSFLMVRSAASRSSDRGQMSEASGDPEISSPGYVVFKISIYLLKYLFWGWYCRCNNIINNLIIAILTLILLITLYY